MGSHQAKGKEAASEVVGWTASQSSKGEGPDKPGLVFYESNSEGEDNLMVSDVKWE